MYCSGRYRRAARDDDNTMKYIDDMRVTMISDNMTMTIYSKLIRNKTQYDDNMHAYLSISVSIITSPYPHPNPHHIISIPVPIPIPIMPLAISIPIPIISPCPSLAIVSICHP